MNKNSYFDSPGNGSAQINVEGYKTSKLKYNKKQVSVMNIAMSTVGIGFIYLTALGFLLEYLVFLPMINNGENASAANILIGFASIGILVGSIMSLIWTFRINKASTAFAVSTVFIYTTAYAIGFGSLFSLIQYQSGVNGIPLIMSAFGIVGFIFLGTFAITKLISLKGFVTLSKIVLVSSIFGFVAMLGLIIASMFIFNSGTQRWVFVATIAISTILSILFLVYQLWCAQNMDKFYMDQESSFKMGLFVGFQILLNVTVLLFNILRLIAIFNRD